MASLTALSFTMVGGICIFTTTLSLFGCAMARQSTYIAARCTSRPKNVIYNPNPTHPSQFRGNPMLGWILWCMRLTYGTMLRGVPGTGTRNGGLSGALLKVNLDGIVLLRFHHLCLRVCLFASVLYVLIVLPVYVTAQCSRLSNDLDTAACSSVEYNLTDYQRLTLSNVPSLRLEQATSFRGIILSFFKPDHEGSLGRLYIVVICSWLVAFFAMHELELEWGDVLAMRRVYYLEADHWRDRQEELHTIYMAASASAEKTPKIGKHGDEDDDDSHLVHREPWVPHPEQRDTVPNVALYSILVGSLPSLPTELAGDEEDQEAAVFSRKQSIDWQLSVTTAFFDHCVPNQPGFSSSVAAVTILPAASHLTDAWNQWYRAAGRLRRLRYIRRQIAEKRQTAEKTETADSNDENSNDTNNKNKKEDNFDDEEEREYEVALHPIPPPPPPPSSSSSPRQEQPPQPKARSPLRKLKHQHSSASEQYQSEVLGSVDDVEVETNLLNALNFGPEQTAVYSREFAQGAGNLAPYGWFEQRIRRAGIEELLVMEKQAVDDVHEANMALAKAQEKIAEDSSESELSEDELVMIMKNASMHGGGGTIHSSGAKSSSHNGGSDPNMRVNTSRLDSIEDAGEFGEESYHDSGEYSGTLGSTQHTHHSGDHSGHLRGSTQHTNYSNGNSLNFSIGSFGEESSDGESSDDDDDDDDDDHDDDRDHDADDDSDGNEQGGEDLDEDLPGLAETEGDTPGDINEGNSPASTNVKKKRPSLPTSRPRHSFSSQNNSASQILFESSHSSLRGKGGKGVRRKPYGYGSKKVSHLASMPRRPSLSKEEKEKRRARKERKRAKKERKRSKRKERRDKRRAEKRDRADTADGMDTLNATHRGPPTPVFNVIKPASPPSSGRKTPEGRASGRRPFQLPGDLGLEAGLWIEQKNLSLGNSQHTSRKRAPPGRSSSGSAGRPSNLGRTTSDLGAMYNMGVTAKPLRRTPPGRTTSDVGAMYGGGGGPSSPSGTRPARRAPPGRTVSDVGAMYRGGGPPSQGSSDQVPEVPARRLPPGRAASDVGAINGAVAVTKPARRLPPGRTTSDISELQRSTQPLSNRDTSIPYAIKAPLPSPPPPPPPPPLLRRSPPGRAKSDITAMYGREKPDDSVTMADGDSRAMHQERLRNLQNLNAKVRGITDQVEKENGIEESWESDGESLSEESLKGSPKHRESHGSESVSASIDMSIDTISSSGSLGTDDGDDLDDSSADSLEDDSKDDSKDSIKSNDKPASFWEKLEEENRRKAKLRARLFSMQNDQNSPPSGVTKNANVEKPHQHPRGGSPQATKSQASTQQSRWETPAGSAETNRNPEVESKPSSIRSTSTDGMDMSPMKPRRRSLDAPPGAPRRTESDGDLPDSPPQSREPKVHIISPVASPRSPRMDPIKETTAFDPSENQIPEIDWERAMPPQPPDSFLKSESRRSLLSVASSYAEENIKKAIEFETTAGLRDEESSLRHRRHHAASSPYEKWEKVESIVHETAISRKRRDRKIPSGAWVVTSGGLLEIIQHHVHRMWRWATAKRSAVAEEFSRDSTYAVVTFTSRQAAVAARHCLADSRGADRWVTVSEIPVPPLADAAACNLGSFRGCVRPVTLSINEKQKIIRHQLALAALATIYFFYTIPLVAAQRLVEPESLKSLLPDIEQWQQESAFLANIFSGLIPALIYTAFFAVCPALFKVIANFGSNATSSVIAENSALQYFWWFMVLAAFSGTSFSTAVIDGFNQGIRIGAELQDVVKASAQSIPSTVSATWLNWIVVRFTIVLPTQYLLQMNTFIFSFLGLRCCSRVVRGGGAGAPVPYRIYVDSGVVLLCVFALAPAAPLIAPAAFIYFLFCVPLLRWTFIFLYKPKFDMGGSRFPFIFDMCVSGMVVGQILLVAMMSLKQAAGPALAASLPLIPTIVFRYLVRRRYLRAFTDAALLQTSLLDGWDVNEESSLEKREEFRQFLVDSHKAAYVPVCIASAETTVITAEPAVVVDLEYDEEDLEVGSVYAEQRKATLTTPHHHQPGEMLRRQMSILQPGPQPGQMLRRASVAQKRRVSASITKEEDSESSAYHEMPMKPHSFSGGLMSPGYTGSPRRRVKTFKSPSMRSFEDHRTPTFLTSLPESPVL